ncbi:Coatomer subunit alpha-2 [Ananas comosus]|uniref:Coatomer subunit alpha-2 n=1 Tax=Ananas comosus TaxID=4615 RepID=A0A199V3D7_ANACO|nr:Coatomer subunit alpha-2 [Ananas comosus]
MRMLLKNSLNEAQAKKAKQVLHVCGDRKDANRLNYDYRNPFIACAWAAETTFPHEMNIGKKERLYRYAAYCL